MAEKVSIIIPVYNVEEYLERCVISVCKQNYGNLEIILINDGSTDSSGMLCLKLQQEDSRIRVIQQENKGVSAARNAGLKVATGEYICFVDSDDWIEEDMIAYLVNLLTTNQADISICDYYSVPANETVEKKQTKEQVVLLSKKEAERQLLLYSMDLFTGYTWNKLFAKKILKNIEFNENIACFEDLLFCFQSIEESKSIVFGNQKKYYYFQRDNSVIHGKYSEKYFSSFQALEKIGELCEKKENAKFFFERYSKEIINQAILAALIDDKEESMLYIAKLVKKIPSKKFFKYIKNFKWRIMGRVLQTSSRCFRTVVRLRFALKK